MLTLKKYFFICICTIVAHLFICAGYSFATIYRLCVPQEHSSPTYQKLFNSIRQKGLTTGNSIEIVLIALPFNLHEEDKNHYRQLIAEQCDLFFSTGDAVPTLFKLELQTPLLFISTIGPGTKIPESMKDTATGFYWGPTATIFKKSLRFLPENSNNIAIIYFRGSKLINRTSAYENIARELGLTLTIGSYKDTNDISRLMKELKAKKIDGIFLFPPAIRNADLPELIKWQNSLKLPIIGQSEEHIREGLLGGPAVDSDLINGRLTDYAIKILNGRSAGQLPIIYLSRPFMLNLSTVSKLDTVISQDVIDQSKILGSGVYQKNETQQAAQLVPGNFTIGVPDNISESAVQNLLKSLQQLGYEKGRNLTILKYALSNPNQDKQLLADKISKESDVFFTTGNAFPNLIDMPKIKPPVCFIATSLLQEIDFKEPTSQYTGVIRASADAVFLKSTLMIKGANRIGFLDREKRDPTHKDILQKRKTIASKHGISVVYRTFAHTADIAVKMQELQALTDFILLYPHSVTDEDLAEIVVWQNKLKFPVLGQTREQIQAGLVGGPTIDHDRTSPKLASYIDKLLHGRKANSLPMYHIPENIIVNLRTVSNLGIELPEEIISMAEIIR